MKETVIPPHLRPGDAIGLIAPSRWADEETISRAEELIRSRGYEPVRGRHLNKRRFQFGGTDAQRAEDFQWMLDDGDIKAVMALRGGYGLVRILDELDFSRFAKQPKWLCGYSDFTLVHSFVNHRLNVATLHCSMPVNFNQNTPESLESVFAGLEGRLGPIDTRGTVILNPGRARGRLLGGNLSILQSLLGSPDALPDEPFILFAEDVGEYLYHVERLFFSLHRAGVLSRIAGFLGGTFSDMRDNTKAFGQAVDNPFGKTALEIVRERIEPLGIPACVGYQAGHCDDNRALVLGAEMEIEW